MQRSPFRDLFVYDTVVQPNMDSRSRERHHDEAESEERMRHHCTTSPGNVRGTSRQGTVKGKERADSPCETSAFLPQLDLADTSASAAGSVAQLAAQTQYLPPPRPSTARPPRFGHRSLLQSVKTHLKQGNNEPDGVKGTGPRRHRDGLPTSHDSTSPTLPALRTQLSDVACDTQWAERGSELHALTPSQGVRHRDPLSDSKTHASQLIVDSPPETMARTRVHMSRAASEPKPVPESLAEKLLSSSSTPPKDVERDDAHPICTPSDIHDLPKAPSFEPANGRDNLISLPPTIPYATLTTTTTSPPQFHALPISSTSENLSHQETKHGSHMEISTWDSSINERPFMSTLTPGDEPHYSASSSSRKELLARLKRERLRAHAEETDPPPLTADRSSRAAEVDRQALFTPDAKQNPATRVVDPHVIEAKLRTRAQLQVRLAAEKRSYGV
ncbi:hypothetical protein DXG01_004305 [Tephrocybe rancida]|nr:hypothetical protein DXG01_004305 [Tephrocybe rancida]